MTVHLLKMAVGVEDVPHLAEIQKRRRAEARAAGRRPVARHLTRNSPRRTEEVLDGGSIYWIIRGYIQVRQRIIGIEPVENAEGRVRCGLMLAAKLVRTLPRRHRPMQGWRYLDPASAPPDAVGGSARTGPLPPEMEAELRALGRL